MTNLFARVKELAHDPAWNHAAVPNLPLSESEVARAEVALGFLLPPTLKRLYLEVADGNFGAGYGILPLLDGVYASSSSNLVPMYLAFKDDPNWLEGCLLFCYHGCGIYSVLDTKTGRVGIVDLGLPEDEPMEDFVLWQKDSLESWLMAWCDSENLFFPLEDDDA